MSKNLIEHPLKPLHENALEILLGSLGSLSLANSEGVGGFKLLISSVKAAEVAFP